MNPVLVLEPLLFDKTKLLDYKLMTCALEFSVLDSVFFEDVGSAFTRCPQPTSSPGQGLEIELRSIILRQNK
jgi:hypothetical protein